MQSAVAALVLLVSLAAPALAQTPVIGGLANNYSFVAPGLPNYAIAQGSIFAIFGTNLANATTGLQNPPLQTSLNGVAVTATVSGVTEQALIYYLSATQITAILPSSIPIGTGQITVTNNGKTSAAAQLIVAPSAFGILTLNGAGNGPAASFDVKFNYLGTSNAANPGDTVILWGSGAGPVPDDTQQSPTTAPIEVDIGGLSAVVQYQGRSQYAGLDQINVMVPAGVSGCYVSVAVRSGTLVSNFSSIPVAASGRVCSDQTTGYGALSSSQAQALAGKSTITTGVIGLTKTTSNVPATVVNGITIVPASSFVIDNGFAAFSRVTLPQNFDPYAVAPGAISTVTSVGSCAVYNLMSASSVPPSASSLPAITTVSLNAGPFVNVTGPAGKAQMAYLNGVYGALLGAGAGASSLPVFIPPTGGSFTFDNGSGGPDVKPFTAQVSLTPIAWTNSNITSVTRTQGVSVTWTGGDQNGYVSIGGTSSAQNGSQYMIGNFVCLAPAAAHQFTVPPAVLLALPPSGTVVSGGVTIPAPGSLAVTGFTNLSSFTVPGVDLAYGYASASSAAAVTYQ